MERTEKTSKLIQAGCLQLIEALTGTDNTDAQKAIFDSVGNSPGDYGSVVRKLLAYFAACGEAGYFPNNDSCEMSRRLLGQSPGTNPSFNTEYRDYMKRFAQLSGEPHPTRPSLRELPTPQHRGNNETR